MSPPTRAALLLAIALAACSPEVLAPPPRPPQAVVTPGTAVSFLETAHFPAQPPGACP